MPDDLTNGEPTLDAGSLADTTDANAAAAQAIARATADDPAAARPRGKVGRHKKDCPCPVCRQRRGETSRRVDAPGLASPGPAPSPPLDSIAIKRSLRALADGGNKWLVATTRRRCLKAAPSMVEETVDAVELQPEDREQFAELATAVLEKYPALARHTPEAFLAAFILAHGARVAAVFSKLASLEAQQAGLLKRGERFEPPPEKVTATDATAPPQTD